MSTDFIHEDPRSRAPNARPEGWLLNLQKAAALLGLHRNTFRQFVSDGHLPGPMFDVPKAYWHIDDLTAEGIRRFRSGLRKGGK